jgi:hypothetical protein
VFGVRGSSVSCWRSTPAPDVPGLIARRLRARSVTTVLWFCGAQCRSCKIGCAVSFDIVEKGLLEPLDAFCVVHVSDPWPVPVFRKSLPWKSQHFVNAGMRRGISAVAHAPDLCDHVAKN